MEISYLGYACFKLKFKTAVLVCDPFDPAMVGIKYPQLEADIVSISHNHPDHNYTDRIKGVKKIISGPGEYEIMGVSILGYPAFHDHKNGEERGRNTVYVFEGDGLRIAHLGDLGCPLTEKEIEELGQINILMIPCGGTVNLEPKEAASIVSSIEPNIVLPMHFLTPEHNSENFGKLKPIEDFLKETGLVTEKVGKLSLKVSDLPEDTKVMLLERK